MASSNEESVTSWNETGCEIWRHALTVNIMSRRSTSEVSLVKRLMMRPRGLVWKNDIGALHAGSPHWTVSCVPLHTGHPTRLAHGGLPRFGPSALEGDPLV